MGGAGVTHAVYFLSNVWACNLEQILNDGQVTPLRGRMERNCSFLHGIELFFSDNSP